MLYRTITFSLLLATWLVFSGVYDAFHITLGLISCGLVTWMSSDLLFEDRSMPLRTRIVQGWRLTGYLAWLMWQVVLSNLHLLKLTLMPGGMAEVKPRITHYRTSLKTDFEKFLLANSITLTPGTITVKILGDEFYIHAISEFAAGGLDGQMERRIAAIFAGDDAGKPGNAPLSD
ncbi:MAG: Na+/H+ antiporter subunit E [Verrucomicrobiae bacterium]|nr:Na+/H+ antiporter subunit E [Verrucomicrobiae bacterium]